MRSVSMKQNAEHGLGEMTGDKRVAERSDPARVTLQVIAERLDVSTATVSLALRGSPVVAESTREKVQSLARDLGYIYNRSAASLRTARTNMVAVGFHDITNPFFAELLVAIEDSIYASGRTVLLATYGENLARQDKVLRTLREYRPDGMILCAAGGTGQPDIRALMGAGIAIVQLVREMVTDVDFVGIDDRTAAREVTEHLIDLGHRRIASIAGIDGIPTAVARRAGWRDAMEARGLHADPALVYEGLTTREVGFAAIRHLLTLPDPPTAAVCFNDLAAFGTMLGLRHEGLEPGRDFSVVGCDDIKEAALWLPGLTTINNRQDELGAEAARVLEERIANPSGPVQRVLLRPRFVPRGTTAPPRLKPA